ADRELKKLELVAADASTGKTRVLLTETQKTFVQPPLLTSYHVPVLEGGKRFLWLSERDGWTHIYLYDRAGTLMQKLTTGDFPVVRIVDVDETEGWVYFTAHADRQRPYDTHLHRVRLDGSGQSRLTESSGQHDFPAYLAALSGAPVG